MLSNYNSVSSLNAYIISECDMLFNFLLDSALGFYLSTRHILT